MSQTPMTSEVAHSAVPADFPDHTIAVILPCFNEAATIVDVIEDFRAALPGADIYVIDNNSSDNTSGVARDAGADVQFVRQQGKGIALRRAFAKVDADIFVMADGDGTYDASVARELVHKLIDHKLDMVVGVRKTDESEAYRSGHVLGNLMFNRLIRALFGTYFNDVFSGYRVMSRAFVKSFPALSNGFEIETEMSVHALQLSLPVLEVETNYGSRPSDSPSKLRTYRDGFLILMHIVGLLKHLQPNLLFGSVGLICIVASAVLGVPIVLEFLETGLVPRMPTFLVSASLTTLGILSIFTGFILDGIARLQLEQKILAYLALSRRSPFPSDL